MKLAWNDDTPIKRNALPNQPDARWALRDELGIDIADAYGRMVYCDDETGDIWYLTEDEKGHPHLDLVTGKVCVSKICLGPKAFRCEWWPKGSIPLHVELAQFDSPFFRGGLITHVNYIWPSGIREIIIQAFKLIPEVDLRLFEPLKSSVLCEEVEK
jgi:hypothetical protein